MHKIKNICLVLLAITLIFAITVSASDKNSVCCKYCGIKRSTVSALVGAGNCSKNPNSKNHEPA